MGEDEEEESILHVKETRWNAFGKKEEGGKHEKFQFAKKRFRPFSLTLFIFNEFSVSIKHLKDTLKDWKAGKQRGSIETSKFE